jgi:nicotinamidase-related amidase
LPDLLIGRAALLVIDMQNDFVDQASPTSNPGALAIVPRIAELATLFRASGWPVIHTREEHRAEGGDGGLEDDPRYGGRAHTIARTRGAAYVRELRPSAGDFELVKRRYSSFLGTELDLLLRQARVETLVLTGVSTDVCVHWTAGEAFQRGYHTRVVEDCVAGTSAAAHEAALLILPTLLFRAGKVVFDDLAEALAARTDARA